MADPLYGGLIPEKYWSTAAASAVSAACSMFAVRRQRKPCRRFVDVSAARRGRQTTKHAGQIARARRRLMSVYFGHCLGPTRHALCLVPHVSNLQTTESMSKDMLLDFLNVHSLIYFAITQEN